VKSAEEQLATAFAQKSVARRAASFVASLTHGPARLWQYQPIVFTRTDYSVRPPKIREGRIATIFSVGNGASTIETLLSDGQVVPLSCRKFPWFRSAFALSIREARQIKEQLKLRVEIGDARRAWPALLLAAIQNSASVVIDPSVARHSSSLAMVLSGTLPAALPTELFVMPDWNAELSAEIAQMTDWFEAIPMPDAPKPSPKFTPPINVADNVRELLASDERSARAFQLLCKLLRPKSGCSEEVAAKLETSAQRLTMHIVNQLRETYRPKKSAEEDDRDDPRRLRLQNPQSWTIGDISELRSDLFAMTFRGSNLDITSIVRRRKSRHSQRANQLRGPAQSSVTPRPGGPRNSSP
jgi:hypothetical protein